MRKIIAIFLVLFAIVFLGVFLSMQINADRYEASTLNGSVITNDNNKIFSDFSFSYEHLIIIIISVLVGAVIGGVIAYAIIRRNIKTIYQDIIDESETIDIDKDKNNKD